MHDIGSTGNQVRLSVLISLTEAVEEVEVYFPCPRTRRCLTCEICRGRWSS